IVTKHKPAVPPLSVLDRKDDDLSASKNVTVATEALPILGLNAVIRPATSDGCFPTWSNDPF
ncbi:MAG: hypothetical protein K0U36_04820, partial [Alphaproteobacteria bacterium]|nr:hypothetical protein [Alphaproteobacteria bacterium]